MYADAGIGDGLVSSRAAMILASRIFWCLENVVCYVDRAAAQTSTHIRVTIAMDSMVLAV